MTGVQTCALPICLSLTHFLTFSFSLFRSLSPFPGDTYRPSYSRQEEVRCCETHVLWADGCALVQTSWNGKYFVTFGFLMFSIVFIILWNYLIFNTTFTIFWVCILFRVLMILLFFFSMEIGLLIFFTALSIWECIFVLHFEQSLLILVSYFAMPSFFSAICKYILSCYHSFTSDFSYKFFLLILSSLSYL